MFGPGRYTESEVLAGYLEQQLAALRAAAYGLTDAQARERPCRSALSIGGLIKHATYVIGPSDAGAVPDDATVADFMASFTLTDDETLVSVLERFDEAVANCVAEVRSFDPDADTVAPPAPWDGRCTPTDSVRRFALVHHIEELARHAGHADILREQLDGADAPSLLMAVEGRGGNQFVQPWSPATA